MFITELVWWIYIIYSNLIQRVGSCLVDRELDHVLLTESWITSRWQMQIIRLHEPNLIWWSICQRDVIKLFRSSYCSNDRFITYPLNLKTHVFYKDISILNGQILKQTVRLFSVYTFLCEVVEFFTEMLHYGLWRYQFQGILISFRDYR
jgi:hypothetical protein